MNYWYIVLLSVMVGVVANEHPPNNPPFVLEELTTSAEFRILERIGQLSRTVGDNMKVLNDRVDKLFGKISDNLLSFSTSTAQRLNNLEHKLERLPEDMGVYFMQPDTSNNVTFEVSRDWTNNHGFGDNWIVFQRRFNGSVNFYRNWTEYKQGFGDLRGEHWLGLEKLHAILETRRHELLIVMEDFDGVIAYAHYDDFKIGDESEKYIIKSVGNYNGTAGDSFTHHKGKSFSTYDQDNDIHTKNCAQSYVGAWWYSNCYESHLNGNYSNGIIKFYGGAVWNQFRGLLYSLKKTKMMIRPVAESSRRD